MDLFHGRISVTVEMERIKISAWQNGLKHIISRVGNGKRFSTVFPRAPAALLSRPVRVPFQSFPRPRARLVCADLRPTSGQPVKVGNLSACPASGPAPPPDVPPVPCGASSPPSGALPVPSVCRAPVRSVAVSRRRSIERERPALLPIKRHGCAVPVRMCATVPRVRARSLAAFFVATSRDF